LDWRMDSLFVTLILTPWLLPLLIPIGYIIELDWRRIVCLLY
jgi:hypothetical protein